MNKLWPPHHSTKCSKTANITENTDLYLPGAIKICASVNELLAHKIEFVEECVVLS